MRNQEYFEQAKDKIREEEDKIILNCVKGVTVWVNQTRLELSKAVDIYDKLSVMTREELLEYARNNNYGR